MRLYKEEDPDGDPIMRAARLVGPLALCALALTPARGGAQPVAPRPVTVTVDLRVELVAIVFRLAGHPEYQLCRVPDYVAAVEGHFGGFREHDVVRQARALRRENGVSYDAVVSFAAHLNGAEASGFRYELDGEERTLEGRWPLAAARTFREALADFAGRSDAAAFFAKQQTRYRRDAERLRARFERDVKLEWFEAFFGPTEIARHVVVAAPLCGPHNYGIRTRDERGRVEVWAVMGTDAVDAEGLPRYGPGTSQTIVHEFAHSRVNPLVDGAWERLEPAFRRLWPRRAERMREQAYSTPRILAYETLVRACEHAYLKEYGGPVPPEAHAAADERRGFDHAPPLGQALWRWRRERGEPLAGPELVTRLAAWIDGWAAAEAQAAARARQPHVIDVRPADGARGIPDGPTEIRVTFDRPMRQDAYSFTHVQEGERTLPFPKTRGRPRYESGGRVIVLPVLLEPKTRYGLALNGGRNLGFRSLEGMVLDPYVIRFETR